MTKERKLAIDMWLWIREHYKDWDEYFWESGSEYGFVEDMKFRFLDAENGGKYPKWRAMCWLCTYMRKHTSPFVEVFVACIRCPLKTCDATDTAYRVLNVHIYKGDVHVSEEVYRNCCTTILNALGYKGE